MNISDYDDLLKGKVKVDATAASTALGAPDVGPPSARDSIYPAAQTPEAPAGGANKKSRLLGMNRNVLGHALGRGAQAIMGKQYEGSPAAMLGGLGAEMNQSQAYASTARKLLAGEPLESIPEASILAPEQLTIALDTSERTGAGRHTRQMDRLDYELKLRKANMDEAEIGKRMELYDAQVKNLGAETAETKRKTELASKTPDEELKRKTAEAKMLTDEDIRKIREQGAAIGRNIAAEYAEKLKLQNTPLTPAAVTQELPRLYTSILNSISPHSLHPMDEMRAGIDALNTVLGIEPTKWPETKEEGVGGMWEVDPKTGKLRRVKGK
jgi:hypothetical protein